MNSKRSYLDTLNTGRQRRPHTTLEQLNRSLETLEQRLEGRREETAERTDFRPAAAQRHPDSEPRYGAAQPYAPRDDRSAAPRPRQAASSPDQNYQAIARDIDRVRGQEDGVAVVGKIAGELRGLREELRHQMTAGLHREFDALRQDIENAYRSNPSAKDGAELGREFERLSGAIQALAEKSDDRGVNMLRLEMEQVKSALDTLAREESVQAVDRRWDDFDRRWTAFEDRVDAADTRRGTELPGLSALTERLEQIGNAVNNLPESLSLRSLEEKVRLLAGAVDHFAGKPGSAKGGEMFGLIDERLDEISRAIVASTVAAQANSFDPEMFARIEQRIGTLADQIEEVAHDRPTAEVIERLNRLSERVDELAAHANLPDEAMERLGQQISLIADKIDRAPAMPDPDYIFQGLEQRFEVLSGMMERRQGDALEQGNILFRDLERRLEEVADRLDRRDSGAGFDSAGIMEAIDARFTAMATRLESRAPDSASETAMRGLESRLEDISSRLESSSAQVAGIDPKLIKSLEKQVAGLSAHLAKPGTALPEFEDIGPRLAAIENSIAGSRDAILEAARAAAEEAARSLAGSRGDHAAVSGLAQDLKTLEALTRRSDDRNTKTFEAIHDTLLKIVDRLGSLEGGEADEQAAQPAMAEAARTAKITVRQAPSMDFGRELPLAAETEAHAPVIDTPEAPALTPAQAASAAAIAALGSDTISERDRRPKPKTSMLGGLARAFRGKREADAPQLAGSAHVDEAPSVDLDQPLDPRSANRPLEPGSGGPDLNAIMKRVRDERSQPVRARGTDAAKSDFIAAARRAAQAAAAEAEVLKRQSAVGGPVRALRIGDLLKARRKPILMAAAAIMLALAGLQLGKAFLADPAQVAANKAAPAKPVKIASATTPKAGTPAKAKAKPQATAPVRVIGDDSGSQASGPKAATATTPNPAPATAQAAASAQPVPAASVAKAAPELAKAADGAPAPSATQPATPNVATAEQSTSTVAPADAALAKVDVPADAGPLALRQAATDGDAKAVFEIGQRYENGTGVKEDMAAAAKWYQKSADLGFAPAEYRLGNFYEKGIGVARDVGKSKTWYQLAAEQGNASAMHNLAVLFAMAADGVTDNESAAHWFQAAADLGVKDSQFNLGILAAKGIGMKQDLEASYKWFALVAKTGDKDAAAKRDEIANALRPEQLERARAATELWKAKPLDDATNSVDVPDSWRDGAPATTASIDMTKAVKNIQLILAKNGYEAGSADGVIGDKTKNAIMAFQSDNGMKATGEVDARLVKALLAHK